MSKLIKLFVLFFILFFASIAFQRHAFAGLGAQNRCMVCEEKEGMVANIVQYPRNGGVDKCNYYDPLTSYCSGPYDSSTGEACGPDFSDPTLVGDDGVCSTGNKCSVDPYKGCVPEGTEGSLSCKTSITSCRFSSECTPPNAPNTCAKNYCVIYRDGVPLEVIKEYSTQYTQGACRTLSTPPQVASPSEVGYYAKSSATTTVGAGTNSIVEPEDPADPPGPAITCDNGNYKNCLKKEFNINIQSGTNEQISDLFNILSQFGRSRLYKSLLFASGPTDVKFSPGAVNCSAHVAGYTYANTLMEFWNFDSARCNTYTRKDRILHESGHVIKNGKGRLFQRFISEAYWPKNSNCYYQDVRFTGGPWFMKTYSTKFAASINNFSITGSNESFAESMANYRSSPTPLGNFPSQCPIPYNWVRVNIFGNYEF